MAKADVVKSLKVNLAYDLPSFKTLDLKAA